MTTPNRIKASTQTHPAGTIKEIVVHATNAQNPRPRALYASIGGDITIINEDGSTTVVGMITGGVLPVQPYRITSVGLATLFGLYN